MWVNQLPNFIITLHTTLDKYVTVQYQNLLDSKTC